MCAGIYWFAHWDSERQPHLISTSEQPDFIINNFTSNAYNEAGEHSYQLMANTLIHFEKQDESHLKNPQFHAVPGPTQHGWRATAKQGIVRNGAEQIRLQQDVTLTTDGAPNEAYHIYAQTLDLFPDKQLAVTDSAVRATQGNHHITSVGLSANWSQGELTLTNEVKSYYEIAR